MSWPAAFPPHRLGFWPGAGSLRTAVGKLLPFLAFALLALLVYRYDAPVALAGALLVVGGIGLLVRPELATLLMVFLLYTNIPAIAYKYHGVPQVVAGAFMLLLFIPLGHFLVVRREPSRSDAAFRLMLLYLAVLLIASMNARGPAVAAERIQTFLVEGLLLYWLLVNVVRDLPALRRTVWTLLAAGSLLGGLSLYQEITGSFDQQFGGLANRNYEFMALEQQLAVTPDDPELLERKELMREDRSRRAEGPMDEPNMYAQIMLALLPLAIFAFRSAPTPRVRLVAAGCGALILGGMVIAESRGAFVALILMMMLAVGIRWIRPAHLLICALMLIPPVVLVASDRLVERVASITSALAVLQDRPATERDYAIEGRATEMMAALQVFIDNPVIGVGPGQYSPFYSVEYQQKNPRLKFSDLRIPRRAHSLYLEVGAELGLVGLAAFLAIVGVVLRDLWRARNHWCGKVREHADLATALFLTLAGYLTTSVFLHLMYERYFWLLLAVGAAAVHVLRRLQTDEIGPDLAFAPTPAASELARLSTEG